MLVPGPNLKYCSTTGKPGKWSEGKYWTGLRQGNTCNGYGSVTVLTDPDRVQLEVKDTEGERKLFLEVGE
jgi:hypothetical protein